MDVPYRETEAGCKPICFAVSDPAHPTEPQASSDEVLPLRSWCCVIRGDLGEKS